jgi:hypothetical protein
VLLHVVESALPIELDRHAARRCGTGQNMPDLALPLLHVDDRNAAHRPPVGGLAPTLGIENRIGEDDERSTVVLAGAHDLGVESPQASVALVGGSRIALVCGSLGHRASG